MEVYNKEKTQIISDYDLSKGRLERDERTIYHEAVKEVVEQFHYEVVKEYENGGKDEEKVVDVKGVPGRDAYEETEDIYVFIPYTDEELKKKEDEILYSELSAWFDWYDIQVSQYERSKRLEITFDRDIATLDAEAVQKAEQMREVKDRLGIE